MKIDKLLIASCVLFVTGGCTNVGRPSFISDRGVSKEVHDATGMTLNDGGLLYQFQLAARDAAPFTGTTLKAQNDPVKQRAFLNAGFALIQARCNEYILAKSDHQRQVNVWRDTFAPITALLTGVVSLASKGGDTNSDYLTALSLGTSAASAGFSIYEQRYLFGAENVNSVRLLIQTALADNAAEAATTPNAKLDYSQTVTHLINNQAVCSPGHILQLVHEAIEAGKIESIKNGEKKESDASKTEAELKDTKALIEQLKKDSILTDASIAAAKAKIAAPAPAPAPSTVKTLDIVTTRVKSSD
jgi:hypothetical protein